jgi:multicomponent Na+:H+ antiporter subunit D
MPFSAAAFVIAGLSLIGVPLTAGFISKWYLLLASLEHGQWLLAVIIVGGSLLALAYVWQVVEQLYFCAPPGDRPAITEAPWSLLIPTWIMVIANVYLGIDSSLTVNLADQAMRALLEAQP